MKNLSIKTSIGMLILAAAIISLSGCAAKKAAWGSMENGMIMKYSFQADRELNYLNTFSFTQEMEIRDQKISITAEGDQLMNMKPLASKNNDLEYLVTIGEMNSKISTPRGEMVANLDEVIGKSFNLTVSELGKELEFSGAKDITYDYGTGEAKSISSDIQTFFSDLPDHPIKVGDTWIGSELITETTGSGEVVLDFTYNNEFVGLETYGGFDCMKIEAVFTGTLEGKGQENGMDLITSGELEGIATWFFAYKEGLLVSNEVNGSGTTNTLVKGPEEMSIPATREYIMRSELADK